MEPYFKAGEKVVKELMERDKEKSSISRKKGGFVGIKLMNFSLKLGPFNISRVMRNGAMKV